MKRILAFVLSLVLLASTTVFARPEQSIIRDYARLVIINKTTFNNKLSPIGSGSAIVIAPGYALSAWHIFQTAEQYSATVTLTQGDREIPVKVVKKDEEADLVLISGDFTCPCAPIAKSMPEVDEAIYAVGYPMFAVYGLQFLTGGVYQGLTIERNKATSTVHAAPGSSGGGMFRKENDQWKLFGVLESIGSAPIGPPRLQFEQQLNWLTFAAPLSTIQTLLKGTNIRVQ